jgi:Sec-independent protein translocase protein TatA
MSAVTTTSLLAFLSMPGPQEMLILAVIALLVFGKDLPHVLREWGKTFNEFRRHLNSVRSELNDAIYAEPERPKLQYHPEFHSRDPLPEQIPAEGGGDLTAGNGAVSAAQGNAATNVDPTSAAEDEPAPLIPSD